MATNFRPCWSFCTPDCRLRQLNCCRREIPRFDLPSPNEGADHILYLKHGRQDYDLHPDYLHWRREWVTWQQADKEGPEPLHWRKRVRDPWAGICIWRDPEVRECYEQKKLYEPMQLQNLLLATPRIIRVIHAAVEEEGSSATMRLVYKELLSFFRNEFREECFGISTGKSEADFKRAFKFLEQTTDLIGRALLLNYELFPLEWSVQVIKYGEPSARWQEWLEHVSAKNRPPKIERVMRQPASLLDGVLEDDDLFISCPIKFDE